MCCSICSSSSSSSSGICCCCCRCCSAKQTHELAEASQSRNAELRAAFGLSEFFKDGSSLDPQRKAKQQAAEALAAAQKKYT